ncbi:MAG: metal-sensitive transcriptional regulator [Anaerolineae bacterium]|nr:metal-sensitive transcriptional regulator [Anaerolineae bacterium]
MAMPQIQASPEAQSDLQKRLARIAGQVRGVQKMLDEGRDCQAVLQQLAAIRAAVQQASLILVRSYAAECLARPDTESPEELADSLIGALTKLP